MQNVPGLIPLSNMSKQLKTFKKDVYSAGLMNSSAASSSKHVRVARWNCCGSQLACCYNDRVIRIWKHMKTEAKTAHEILGAHINSVGDISWHPSEPNLLASCSNDGYIKVWNSFTLKYVKQKSIHEMLIAGTAITKPEGSFLLLRYSPDGNYLAVVTEDNWIIILDSVTLLPVTSVRASDEIFDIAWANDSQHLSLALGDGSVPIYALNSASNNSGSGGSLTIIKVLRGPHTASTTVAFDPRGHSLAVGSNDGIVSIWSLKDWICINTFTRVDESVSSVSYSFDGAYLAIAYDLEAAIDIVSTSPTVALEDKSKYLYSVAKRSKFVSRPHVDFSPSQYSLLYAGEEATGVTVLQQV